MLQLAHQGLLGLLLYRNIHEEEDGNERQAANGQIDVKAPPPRHVRRETTTNQGTGDGSNTHEHAHKALKLRALVQRNHVNQGGDLEITRQPSRPGRRRDEEGKRTTPAKIPAAPIPEIALPMMKTTELSAAPEIADAISKMTTLDIRTHFTGHKV